MSEDCHCSEDKEKIKNEMTHWRKVLKFGLTLDIYIAIKRREHLKNKSDNNYDSLCRILLGCQLWLWLNSYQNSTFFFASKTITDLKIYINCI